MDPVKPKSKEFNALEAYTRDTHGSTHNSYKAKVLHAFRVERQSETDAWMKAGHHKLADGERLLLWHGSRTTNFAGTKLPCFVNHYLSTMISIVGILSQGLRIAPPEG